MKISESDRIKLFLQARSLDASFGELFQDDYDLFSPDFVTEMRKTDKLRQQLEAYRDRLQYLIRESKKL